MKKSIFLLSLILSFSIALFTDVVVAETTNELQATFTTNPIIVAPGTNGYIELSLKSAGSGTVSNIDIDASSWDPTVIQPRGNWDVYINDLDGGDSNSVLYEFYVPTTATPGLYQVVFEITFSHGSIRQTAMIKVEDSTVLDLESVTPSSIKVGEVTTLVFNITNNRASNIYNVLFTWEDPNDLILPMGADNRIIIPLIAHENYTELPINVMASSGISPGVYPLTITMEFYDLTGTKQTITSTVGLQISGTTTFDVVLQTSTSTSTTFAVVNTGANTASSVVVSIPKQIGYSTSGTSSASLGNLEAGDYTLASFQLSSTSSNMTAQLPAFDRSSTGNTPPYRNFSGGRDMFMNQSFSGGGSQLLVQIAYTDLFGVRQTIQKQVDLSSGSSSGFSSGTGTESSSGRFTGGFLDRSQSSDSSNSIMYISIGVIGIIIIVAIIQLGRRKKLGRFSKFFKGRKK